MIRLAKGHGDSASHRFINHHRWPAILSVVLALNLAVGRLSAPEGNRWAGREPQALSGSSLWPRLRGPDEVRELLVAELPICTRADRSRRCSSPDETLTVSSRSRRRTRQSRNDVYPLSAARLGLSWFSVPVYLVYCHRGLEQRGGLDSYERPEGSRAFQPGRQKMDSRLTSVDSKDLQLSGTFPHYSRSGCLDPFGWNHSTYRGPGLYVSLQSELQAVRRAVISEQIDRLDRRREFPAARDISAEGSPDWKTYSRCVEARRYGRVASRRDKCYGSGSCAGKRVDQAAALQCRGPSRRPSASVEVSGTAVSVTHAAGEPGTDEEIGVLLPRFSRFRISASMAKCSALSGKTDTLKQKCGLRSPVRTGAAD